MTLDGYLTGVNPSMPETDDAVRILLLDRCRLLAEVLGRRLINEVDVADVGVASSGAEAIRLLTEGCFDLVVATPELAAELRARPGDQLGRRAAPIVVLAENQSTESARALFRMGGVVGWVSRDRSSADLMDVIRTWQRGDVRIPAEILESLAYRAEEGAAASSTREQILASLTEREIDVLLLLERGKGRTEIAAELHLSPNTVRTHIQRILRRLDVHSTLAALALLRD